MRALLVVPHYAEIDYIQRVTGRIKARRHGPLRGRLGGGLRRPQGRPVAALGRLRGAQLAEARLDFLDAIAHSSAESASKRRS